LTQGPSFPALDLKGEEPGHPSTTQRDDVLEPTGDPTTSIVDVEELTTWPTATPTPLWSGDPPTTPVPIQAGAAGNKTREFHGERQRRGSGMCHHPWAVLYPPGTPQCLPPPPQPPLQAACPHLLSLPTENTSAVPVRYWAPVIFVVVALVVLFFTYRRTRGEGELPAAAPAPPAPLSRAGGQEGVTATSQPTSSARREVPQKVGYSGAALWGGVWLRAGRGPGAGGPQKPLWPRLSCTGRAPHCSGLALKVQKLNA